MNNTHAAPHLAAIPVAICKDTKSRVKRASLDITTKKFVQQFNIVDSSVNSRSSMINEGCSSKLMRVFLSTSTFC